MVRSANANDQSKMNNENMTLEEVNALYTYFQTVRNGGAGMVESVKESIRESGIVHNPHYIHIAIVDEYYPLISLGDHVLFFETGEVYTKPLSSPPK